MSPSPRYQVYLQDGGGDTQMGEQVMAIPPKVMADCILRRRWGVSNPLRHMHLPTSCTMKGANGVFPHQKDMLLQSENQVDTLHVATSPWNASSSIPWGRVSEVNSHGTAPWSQGWLRTQGISGRQLNWWEDGMSETGSVSGWDFKPVALQTWSWWGKQIVTESDRMTECTAEGQKAGRLRRGAESWPKSKTGVATG